MRARCTEELGGSLGRRLCVLCLCLSLPLCVSVCLFLCLFRFLFLSFIFAHTHMNKTLAVSVLVRELHLQPATREFVLLCFIRSIFRSLFLGLSTLFLHLFSPSVPLSSISVFFLSFSLSLLPSFHFFCSFLSLSLSLSPLSLSLSLSLSLPSSLSPCLPRLTPQTADHLFPGVDSARFATRVVSRKFCQRTVRTNQTWAFMSSSLFRAWKFDRQNLSSPGTSQNGLERHPRLTP